MKYKKVMLINPSNTMQKDSIRRISPPLGILYIASILKKERYDVEILDSTCEGYFNSIIKDDYITYGLTDDEIIKRIKKYNPDIVGISSMFSAHQKNAIHYCNLVKQVNKDIIVILGGIHPSLFPNKCICNDSVDFVIIGEGEYRIIKLLKVLNENKNDFEFDGIAYKKENKIIINLMTTRIEDLDILPFPARELIDFEKYIDIGVPYAPFPRKERVAEIMTSRGCPFHCNFCSTVKYWGRKFRMRSVKNIIEEIEILVKKYRIEEIQFPDDNMTINKKRSMDLFNELKKYNLSWCTPHGLMPKTLDKNMIELMAESGAYQLTFAIESGSKRVRDEIIHKPVPIKNEIKKLVEECHKNKMQVHGMFVLGFPGEKKEEIFKTLQYPFDVYFDSASFFIANPMPGSELYKECKEKGYLRDTSVFDFKSADIYIPKNSTDYVMSREDLIKIVDKKTREFNEFSKQRNPGQWDLKFQQFLKRHGDKSDLILGRIT
ncbi:MAG: B12-binding domain-containing radical SAM protein [Promethearchaeia archaeon]